MTQEFKSRISDEITAKEIQDELRKMGYLNKRNLPTAKTIMGVECKEAHDIRGRLYYKWEPYIVDEVGDRLFEKYFPIK